MATTAATGKKVGHYLIWLLGITLAAGAIGWAFYEGKKKAGG